MPGSLVAALADRYTTERELGRGGMAVVYLARDLKHDRKVALKVIRPELAQSVRAERFLREIQIAAKLSHPHILPLYDSGDVDGVLYYVMPYVEGESLRDRLQREKQLPVDDALRITREVASALGEAHDQGVVHRDIKPENILLTRSGHAVVADFGIARALSAAGTGTATEPGLAVGTPAYMSPEQASGSADVDGRSDIYSLGCVLYEMLAGHPPFTGATTQEILARHALDPAPSLRAARSDVPERVERVITKALAKQPVGRFPAAAQFAQVLTEGGAEPRRRPTPRAVVYAVLGALVVIGGALAAGARSLLVRNPVEQSIAVLPFVNMSGDSANEYLSDGVSEELINALVQVPRLRVPARTSSFYFKGKTLPVRQIGESLQVANVLEGSLRRVGTRLRITAQLIKVADGYHLWSATYDRELAGAAGVLAVQEEIARAIVSALEVKLAAPVPARAPNPAAYQLYLKGRFFWNKGTEDGLNRAREFFSAAIAQDSGYARAYAGLAEAYVSLWGLAYVNRDLASPKAWAAAERAVALDSQLADAYASRGRVRIFEWDWSGAEQDLRRAVALDPGNALGHGRYGAILLRRGHPTEAIREARRATELDPLSAALVLSYGEVLLSVRQYDRASDQLRKSLELEPTPQARQRLATVFMLQGKHADAIREFQTTLDLLGDRGRTPSVLAQLGVAFARAGRRQEALQLLDELKARAPRGDASAFSLATLYAGLGEKDSAFAFLERAYQSHSQQLARLRVDPLLDPLRSDRRFAALVKKVGL